MKTITLYCPEDSMEHFGNCSMDHDDPIWGTYDTDKVRCGTRFIAWLKEHLDEIHWPRPSNGKLEYQWRNPVVTELGLTDGPIQVRAERWERPVAKPTMRTITGPDGQTYTRTDPGTNEGVPWVQAQTECSSWSYASTIEPVIDKVRFHVTTLELKLYDDAKVTPA